ncbi:MAG TPA: hypothetical protein VIJ46_06715, partial [Rhabdochlamydiaceae bacterium]
ELLLEFYSAQVAKLDAETLEQNPELLYRKALASYELLGYMESFPDVIAKLPEIKDELQFVLEHADKSSRLFAAAHLKHHFIDTVLKASIKDPQELAPVCLAFADGYLKQWATHAALTGKALRKEVASNVKRDPAIAASFYDFLLLFQDSPDLVLGYIKPGKIEVLGVSTNEDGWDVLSYKIKYSVDRTSCSIEQEL